MSSDKKKKSFGFADEPSWVEGSGEPGAADELGGYNEMKEGGLCHYSGPEADIPLGLAWTDVPNWGPHMAAIKWGVDSPLLPDGTENPEGIVFKTRKELLPTDVITAVILNKKTLSRHKSLIQDANAGKRRPPTFKEYGIIAIRNMRQILSGIR